MNTVHRSAFSGHRFLGGDPVVASATSPSSLPVIGTETSAPVARPASAGKVTVGVIGNGGHGSWITKLFKVPGSHEMWAVADCFQDVAP